MKVPRLKLVFASLLLLVLLVTAAGSVFGQNSINGMVFDDGRRPVAAIEVELLDDLERLRRSTKTKGSGLYIFQGLPPGIYYIRIRTGGTGFKTEKQRVELGIGNRTVVVGTTRRTAGADVRQVNFYLQIDPIKSRRKLLKTGVIFVQDVPEDAKILYETALRKLDKKESAGAVEDLTKAIQIFPDYYDALAKLGNLHLNQKEYIEAENVFKRTTAVNSRNFENFFKLAVAQNKLKKLNDAVHNLKRANMLDSGSINSHLLLGIIQRDLKQYSDAEKSLLRAKKLSDNQVSDVHWNLALLYYHDLKRYNSAADELELYLKAIPKTYRKEKKEHIAKIGKLIKVLREKGLLSSNPDQNYRKNFYTLVISNVGN